MGQTTQQAVNPQPVNFMAALFEATNLAVEAGQNYQLAVGVSTEQVVKMEDWIYNSWKFSLTKSEQFSAKTTGYQSWMSIGKLRSMEGTELQSRLTALESKRNEAMRNYDEYRDEPGPAGQGRAAYWLGIEQGLSRSIGGVNALIASPTFLVS